MVCQMQQSMDRFYTTFSSDILSKSDWFERINAIWQQQSTKSAGYFMLKLDLDVFAFKQFG